MCVIIVKRNGLSIAKEIVKNSARINPHGLGVVWLDTFEISYHKSKEYKVLFTERPFIAHFRYATVGAINEANTHPFRCGKNMNEWLMMNGTIHGKGNKKMSDSRVLANELGEMPRNKWKKELEKYACRFVTINTRNRTYQLYNKHMWVEHEGIWYSKGNVLQNELVAVYGTLKRGNSNYYSYLTQARYVGMGVTEDKYPLVIEGLPYLIERKGIGHNVRVDVFKVDSETMARLDQLEGHPNWYMRKRINIILESGSVVKCWIYFNPRTKYEGKKYHKSYEPMQRVGAGYSRMSFGSGYSGTSYSRNRYTTSGVRYGTPTKIVDPVWDAQDFNRQLEELEKEYLKDIPDDTEFSVHEETPMCVNCYHDLSYDHFGNYHCSGCDSWFNEKEVIRRHAI